MKYIIEIEDEPFVRLSALFGEEGLYRAKGFNSLVFDQFGLDKLTPLDKELEEAYQKGFEVGQHEATTIEYQQGLEEGKKQAKAQAHLDVCHDIERVAHGNYQKGLDDAWETVREILACDYHRRYAIFDVDNSYEVVTKFTASEAIAKIKAYEEQQKADEIKVGDEVDYKGMTKYVVTGIVDDDTICGFSLNGLWNANTIKEVTKTGRHFPQVAELFKAMKGEQRNCSTCKHDNDGLGKICRRCAGYEKWEPKEGAE